MEMNDSLKELQYEVLIKKKRDKYILIAPELALSAEHKSLDQAYSNLELEIDKYFQRMIELDCQDKIIKPHSNTTQKWINDLLLFSSKLLIVLFIVGAASVYFLQSIPAKVINQSLNALDLLVREINQMPEDQKERIKTRLKKAINEIQPFVAELGVLFDRPRLNKEPSDQRNEKKGKK